MPLLYIVGGLVSLGLLIYLVLALLIYLVVLLVLAKPLGAYMARVYEGRRIGLDRALGWLERLIYRVSGISPKAEMGWKTYALTMLIFNLAGVLAVYVLQRLQGVLPLNPAGLGAVSPDSSFNTAVSFATNTNWQGYGGETTMSYLTQMLPRRSATSGSISLEPRSTSSCRSRSSSRWFSFPRVSCRRSAHTRRSPSCSPPSTTSP